MRDLGDPAQGGARESTPQALPNIGKSGDKPKDYTKTVKVEGKAVAIKGASFGSMGDVASKATGGGLISANTHGPTKFIAPGSFDVKFEGKNVQLLGDQMLNNCGPSGSPANSATMMGVVQVSAQKSGPVENDCGDGNHSEVMEYCEVPPGEEDPNKRVEKMKEAGTNDHEIASALHDIKAGHITPTAASSRATSPRRRRPRRGRARATSRRPACGAPYARSGGRWTKPTATPRPSRPRSSRAAGGRRARRPTT